MSYGRLQVLRIVGYAEGTSFLVLLGIAMPLKYLASWPLGVTIVGSAHGVLWILYLLAAGRVGMAHRWKVGLWFSAFAASILPAGPFVFDAWLSRDVRDAESSRGA